MQSVVRCMEYSTGHLYIPFNTQCVCRCSGIDTFMQGKIRTTNAVSALTSSDQQITRSGNFATIAQKLRSTHRISVWWVWRTSMTRNIFSQKKYTRVSSADRAPFRHPVAPMHLSKFGKDGSMSLSWLQFLSFRIHNFYQAACKSNARCTHNKTQREGQTMDIGMFPDIAKSVCESLPTPTGFRSTTVSTAVLLERLQSCVDGVSRAFVFRWKSRTGFSAVNFPGFDARTTKLVLRRLWRWTTPSEWIAPSVTTREKYLWSGCTFPFLLTTDQKIRKQARLLVQTGERGNNSINAVCRARDSEQGREVTVIRSGFTKM